MMMMGEMEMESQTHLRPLAMDSVTNSIFRKSQRPVTLEFNDVVYKIKIKAKKGSGEKGPAERTILKGVSGILLPGEMMALMGPSGCGKTTLLTALGARLGSSQLTGAITYNGRPFSTSLKRNMGFVTQDDVLYPHLTVAETLLFTALLRLPRTLSRQEKAAQADAVLTQLGLSSCRNSIIGGPLVRGVSGGERKRVSIGQEMLINPSLILLDEPTSGLDSTTAQRIVSTLADFAGGGRTVLMTIHQPSSQIFYMFHKLLLLSDGSPVYFGKAREAMDYFASIGHAPAVAMNPSDFILDLANGAGETPEGRVAMKQALVSAYEERLHDAVKAEMKAAGVGRMVGGPPVGGPEKEVERWSSTWWEQFTVLMQRGLKERRHEAFSGIKIAQITITAIIAGLLWWQSRGHVSDQIGLLFFITGLWSFQPIFEAIFTFPQERAMLEKERSSGTYRLSSYFFARTATDLPMELILPILSTTAIYWMGGLKPTAAAYFETLLIILLGCLVSQGLGLMMGALMMDLKAATTLANVVMLVFMLAGGFFVQKVPAFIGWTKYVSLIYYSFKLTVIAQFSPGETFDCGGGKLCPIEDIPDVKVVGLHDKGLAVGMLFAMLFVFRLVAYLALTRIGASR